MKKDIVKNAVICLSHLEIEDTTYKIARDIVIEEYEEQKEEIKRLNNIINELDNFLDKQIEKENQLLNPKKGVKPYGDEKFYYEIYKSCLVDIKLKLNRLKENNND